MMMMINLMMMINQPDEDGLPAYSHQSYSHLVGKYHDDEGREHDTVYTKLQGRPGAQQQSRVIVTRELPDQKEQGGQDD